MLLSTCIDIIASDHARIARYAERRSRFLDALDWSQMTPEFCRRTSMADEWVDLEAAEAWSYLQHLDSRLAREGDGPIEMFARFVIPPHLLLAAVPA